MIIILQIVHNSVFPNNSYCLDSLTFKTYKQWTIISLNPVIQDLG